MREYSAMKYVILWDDAEKFEKKRRSTLFIVECLRYLHYAWSAFPKSRCVSGGATSGSGRADAACGPIEVMSTSE